MRRTILGSGLVAMMAVTVANAEPKRSAAAALEDPCIDGSEGACKRRALDGFRSALKAQQLGKADRPLRISYVGDSLTADDQITSELRTKLGAQLGDGGPGFAFAVEPHPYCEHRALTRVVSGEWRVHGVSSAPPADRLLGLGGSAETDGGGSVKLVAATPIARVDVHYLAQKGGGAVSVLAGGKPVGTIETAADGKRAGFALIAVPDGTTKIELAAKGKVRLFGAAMEAAKGVVVDNLGVVNATAKQLRTKVMAAHWRNQLAHRKPDLLILMFGTNEAEWIAAKSTAMAEHEKLYGELLATARAANPRSSCLVVSPLDQLDWRTEGAPPRESVPALVEAQRRAAQANGCAFFDTYAWMGGKGASKQWSKRGLVMKDFQHPTAAGAKKIGDALYSALTSRLLTN